MLLGFLFLSEFLKHSLLWLDDKQMSCIKNNDLINSVLIIIDHGDPKQKIKIPLTKYLIYIHPKLI